MIEVQEKKSLTQDLNLVRASVRRANVRALNAGSYARNSAIRAIEKTLGKRVKLATHAFTSIKQSQGRGKKSKEVLSVALVGGQNIIIKL